MHGLLFATGLMVLIAALWRLTRALRKRRAAVGARSLPATLPVALAPRVAAGSKPSRGVRGARGGVLVLEGLPLERVELDDLPYPLAGLTIRPARGLYDVPCGRHRVRVRRDEAPRSLDVVMPAGGTLAVSLSADGGLVARSAERADIDAGYIHYPTWARGPLLGRRTRREADAASLADDLAAAFTATDRGAAARVADRLVGLPLTEAELESLRRLCAEQVARAPAGEREEARARAALLLPEVEAPLLKPV